MSVFSDSPADYDFDLPDELIAQRPAEKRDQSRLLFMPSGNDVTISNHIFSDLPAILKPTDLLVQNDTKVIPARLRGKRDSGGATELLLIHRHDERRWVCLARSYNHLKIGKSIYFQSAVVHAQQSTPVKITAIIKEMLGNGRVIAEFDYDSSIADTFFQALSKVGEIPLPPYIHRENNIPDSDDVERYQTLYANTPGAVAAPTAGLHFTPEVDAALKLKGIDTVRITLHVGSGTFRPIKTDSVSAHEMDAEWYDVPVESANAINRAKRDGRRIVAVGTTSTRTLETAASEDGVLQSGSGWSRLFIRPGYSFRIVDVLLTNFHLPRSSLLVLISAFSGRERVLSAYREAIKAGYRFYSYGDATLLERHEAELRAEF